MEDLPSHTKHKAENDRMEVSSRMAFLPEAMVPSRWAKWRWIPPSPQLGKGYSVAFGATLLAFLLRWSVDAYLGESLAYATFLVAIAITSWYGGIGPSVAAVALGGLIANGVFIHPRYALSVTDLEDQAGIAVYLTVSFAMVGFVQTWRWAWKKTEEMTQELRREMDRHRQTEEEPAHSASAERTPASQGEQRV